MPFDSVRFSSFRNLEDAEVGTQAERVFLVGENGQGKTNFLEALYFLSFGNSFRGSVESEAVKHAAPSFALSGRIWASKGMPPDDIDVSWQGKTKEIRRNGKTIRDRKELIELNPAIVFCHEDYSFAAGEPERRRFFFDQAAGLVSIGYIDTLREYRRILKQRNAALKDARSDLVTLLDIQLTDKGLDLMQARSKLRDEFDSRFALRFEAVSQIGAEVHISYKPNWGTETDQDEILGRLASRRTEELALKTSLSGPHRDRWNFMQEGADFCATASTGQLRLLSLTLRMVQAEYYTAHTGRLPVVLLDDVLLELDRGKRRRFLDLLPPSGQAFFTFLPGESWEEYATASSIVYEVRNGRFEN
jgi:DNA replication and repair protein RecF